MSYSVESINGCTKKLVFNFEGVDLSTQIEDALKEKQKNSNLKGFRKGKAPMNFVKQVYGAQAENDALYRFVSQEFYKAVQEEKLQAVGYPAFGNTKFENDNVSFEATVEIFPEVDVKDYSSYEFTKGDDSVSDADFEEMKNRYLAPKAEMVEVTDENKTLENGLFAVFNFEGEKPDGTKPENMKAEEFLLEIGSGQFIPGFEEGMVGLKKGEKKTIEVTFPSEYHEPDLRDMGVKFHVELLEIKERKVPELTDELAKEFGFESVEDFNTKNKARLVDQKKREVSSQLNEQILKKLVEDNPFDVPQALIDQQKTAVREDLGANLRQQGFDESMTQQYFEKWEEDIIQKAEFQVRSGLILDKISKKYEIEATEEDFNKKIDEMATQSGMERDQISGYYSSNENIKNNIMYAIREEKTFDKLISEMKVK
ncbi:MAG: trigger factor [Halobacteriovoraceae bacterium]|nr:trigger factor [Halobacteriovoraceae bacterium]|tara:strand:+ start:3403 stop:4683 length:1281 start_codon:yes stop_codon:yes gene_type:complete